MFEIFSAVFLAGQCADVAVPQASVEAMRWYQSGNFLWVANQMWSLLLPLLFLVTGFTGKIEHLAERWGRKWFFVIALYLIFFIALYQFLSVPIDYYGSYLRPHQYGLSTQSLAGWLSNYAKMALVLMVTAVAFVWIFYLLLKKSPRRWWFYSSLASIVLLFLMTFVQPIWVDPLFNHFGPMKDKVLEKEILAIARRAGIEQGRVYEVDKSQETRLLNAYVTGIWGTNRIVLWDTTVKRMPKEQILFVMAHEMGHYVLHHVWWMMGYSSALSFLLFYLTYRSANALLERFSKRFQIRQLSSISSLPLILLLIGFYTFLLTPLTNALSRVMERQADQFGLEVTQNNRAAGEAFITLQQDNLGNPWPGPLFTFWRASHPSLGERVDSCNSYCPWKEGKPLRYADDLTHTAGGS